MKTKIKDYKKYLKSDLIAGITVSLILIPQSLAYAQLAGLPPHYGLYAALIPPVLAAIFGSSKQLSTGPVAVLSLMTASAISIYYKPGTSEYITIALMLSFSLGVFQIILSIVKLGGAVSLLSHPVTYGFTNAAALIIASTQLSKLFGVTVPPFEHQYQTVFAVFQKALTDLDLQTFSLGLWAITAIILLRMINKKFPSVIVVLFIATAFSWLSGYKGDIVGSIPNSIPSLTLPQLNLNIAINLFPTVIIMGIVGFSEAISVAQSVAIKTKDRIDPNKELLGQGIANLVGSLFQSFPTSGSFSRTAVNFQAGGKTAVSSIVTGVIVLLSLLFFTKFIYYLPQVILAAVIIVSVSSLINVKKLKLIWSTSRHDAVAAFITFFVTLFYAPHLDRGLAMGVIFSIGYYLYKNTHPRVVFLSKYKDGWFHDANKFNLKRCTNIAVVRLDGQLFFANSYNFETKIINDLANYPRINDIILVCSGINALDSTGENMLYSLWKSLNKSGKNLYFSSLKSQISEVLKRSGLRANVGDDHFYPTLDEAVKNVILNIEKNDKHSDMGLCPLEKHIAADITNDYQENNNRIVPFYKKALLRAKSFSRY